MVQCTVSLDEGEEEESEVTQEALVGMGGGEKKRKRSEDRRLMTRRWRKLGRGEERKGKEMRPKCRGCRTRCGCTRSLWRRTRVRGGRAHASEGRRGRKTGGEVRSGKNVIIKVARREERRRVRAPANQRGRRRGKARTKRSVKDAISVDYQQTMFCPSNTASSRQLSIGTWNVGKDVNSSDSRGWPLPSTGLGKREGGLSFNVPVQAMTASSLLSKDASRRERFDTKPPVKGQETS